MKVLALILSLFLILSYAGPIAVAVLFDDDDENDDALDDGNIIYMDENDEAAWFDFQSDSDYDFDYEFHENYVLQISEEAKESLRTIVAERDIIALVYLSSTYTVRQTASSDGEAVVVVRSGQQVSILDVELDVFGNVWVYVSLHLMDTMHKGFIERGNLATPDVRFLDWEDRYDIGRSVFAPFSAAGAFAPFGAQAAGALTPDVAAFPPSYQAQLAALKAQHPNWTFVRMDTNIDWNWMVAQQMYPGRALVHRNQPAFKWTGPAVEPGWHQATEIALKHYLDPRNWLQTPHIFMFELLSFNEAFHTVEGTQAVLNNTFMRGRVGFFNYAANPNGVPRVGADSSITYAQAFYNAGRSLGVSPFFLAARVRQEQGVLGENGLVSGAFPGFEGFFNYFNIRATGPTTHDIIVNGLRFASSTDRNPRWNTRVNAITGGSSIVSASYIRNPRGAQDTIYLQKFNASGGHIWHQYMTNIMAPRSESILVFNTYNNSGALGNPFVFKIPVYLNMPEAPSFLPTNSFDIALIPPLGYNSVRIFLDGVEFPANRIHGQYVVNPGVSTKTTAVMHNYDANGIPVGMFVWRLSHSNGAYTATAVPGLQDLITYHGFSIRILGNSGIRFHSGIDLGTRNALLSTGIDGFTLREYGTIVMNNNDSGTFPLVRGGQRTAGGISFGHGVDALFAIQNNRGIFTSVLVNLPPSQFKTEFLFRGYVVLVRNGVEHVFYGPPVSRSIYTVANQVLQAGQFPVSSEGDAFIRRLIEDAG